MFNIKKPSTPHNTSQYLSKYYSSDNVLTSLNNDKEINQNTPIKCSNIEIDSYKDEDLDMIDTFLHGGTMLGKIPFKIRF